jgi:hypothetical protein
MLICLGQFNDECAQFRVDIFTPHNTLELFGG